MNILYLSVKYSEVNPNLYNDLINELIRAGHSITIFSSNINENIATRKNLEVITVKTSNYFSSNPIKKGLSLLSIERKFINSIKRNASNKNYDLILYATPPISFNGVVKYCKKNFKAKSFLMLKDIFPQNAVDLDYFGKKSFIYKIFRRKEKKLYEISDYIGCMSQGNIDYVIKHNPDIDSSKIHLFYNSIEIKCDKVVRERNDITTFLFGGNLGKPQNIKGLLKVIDLLKEYPNAKFKIAGNGTDCSLIEDYIKKNNGNCNLEFLGYLNGKEFNKVLGVSDVGIISLDPRFTIPNIPSRLLSYMHNCIPVLAISDTSTDLNTIIKDSKCGWWCDASKHEQIVELIKDICENRDQQIKNGINGYDYLKKNFNVKINVNQIEEFLEVSTDGNI